VIFFIDIDKYIAYIADMQTHRRLPVHR